LLVPAQARMLESGSPVHMPLRSEVLKMGRLRILLADDHPMGLDVLKEQLEPEFEVVGSLSDIRAVLAEAPSLKPDIILLGPAMQQATGVEEEQQLAKTLPNTKLIVIAMNENPSVARDALRGWASGFPLSNAGGSEVSKTIREVNQVQRNVAEPIAHLLHEDAGMGRGNKTLTHRQREVLQLLAEGMTMREAALRLSVTPRTVAFHKYRIMKDFSLRTNSDLVRFAIRKGIITSI
jgi:DNA-binding NarL/FixJ family response regulator